MSLKHTDFMQTIARQMSDALPAPYQHFRLGETRWLCQLYYGRDRRIHYEVSRPFSRSGRKLEIGLHFESRESTLNRALLVAFDRHLLEIQAARGREVKAEIWDKGWTKVYEIYPDDDLTEALARQITQEFADFISVLQPIYEKLKITP